MIISVCGLVTAHQRARHAAMNVLPDFLYFAPKRQALDKLARRVAPKRQIQNPPLVRRQFEGLTFLVKPDNSVDKFSGR